MSINESCDGDDYGLLEEPLTHDSKETKETDEKRFSLCKSKIETNKGIQFMNNNADDSRVISEAKLSAEARSKSTAKLSSAALLEQLNARMKFHAEVDDSTPVIVRKKKKLASENLTSDIRKSQTLQAVIDGAPTLQNLHTALLKHGMLCLILNCATEHYLHNIF